MAAQLASARGSTGHFNIDKTVKKIATEKQQIPVVPNKFTDEEIGNFDGKTVHHLNLEKIIALLKDKQTDSQTSRHIVILRKLFKASKDGFHMKDLPNAVKIVEILFERHQDASEISEVLVDLVDNLSKPYLMENMSDVTAYHDQTVTALRSLAELLKTQDNFKIKHQILRTFLKLQSAEAVPSAVHKHRPISFAQIRNIINESEIAAVLIDLLKLTPPQKDADTITARALALDILEKLSRTSRANCHKILNANGASLICQDMFDAFQKGCDHVFVITNVLWNLVETVPDAAVAQLSNLECIGQIKDAFMYHLTQGHNHYERQLRNDLLVISTLILRQNPIAPLVETGFAKLLVLFSTYPETKSHNPLVKNFKLHASQEDMELKKLLFNFLVVASKDPTMLLLMQEQHVMLALFEYVRPNETDKWPKLIDKLNDKDKATGWTETPSSQAPDQSNVTRLWPPAYFEELQLHSLACLSTLAPKLISEYLLFNGGTRLLMLLDWCIGASDFGGFGNSNFGSGGRGSKRAQMRHCLRLIRSVVATGNDAVCYDLCDQGLIPLLTGMLGKFVKLFHKAADGADVEIISDMMYVLAAVCETDVHRKEIFGTAGIDALLQLFETNPKSMHNGEYFMRILQHTVEATWCCVVGCPTNEDYFVQRGGVFMLLDLLQFVLYDRSHFVSRVSKNGKRKEDEYDPSLLKQALQLTTFNLPVVSAILGCLVDLCEAVKPVAHVKAWTYTPSNEVNVVRSATNKRREIPSEDTRNGPPQRSAVHLLCELWRVEEIRLQAARYPDTGEIADINNPLIALNNVPPIKYLQMSQSASINDVFTNLRARIYSLFCKFGFVDILASGITTEDNVTLCIIEKYLDFKTAEVWREICEELDASEVRPITPDIDAIEFISECALLNAKTIAAIQHEIYYAQNQMDVQNEQKYYSELRDTHHQKQMQLERFKQFVERTSKHDALKAAREDQLHMIHASRSETRYKDLQNFHSVERRNLHTTVFCEKRVEIDSTPKEVLQINQFHGNTLENLMMLEWSQQPPIIEYESDVEDANEDPSFKVGTTDPKHNGIGLSDAKQSRSVSGSGTHSQPSSAAATAASAADKSAVLKESDYEFQDS